MKSRITDYLNGYVIIDKWALNPIKVLGTQWSTDFDKANELAAKLEAIPSSRNWVRLKLGGEDPVKKFKLTEVKRDLAPNEIRAREKAKARVQAAASKAAPKASAKKEGTK